MTPIEISSTIENMSIAQLRAKLNVKAYTFCVTADFANEAGMNSLITSLEMYVMESILRILSDKCGYRPLQNKIYEKIEHTFDTRNAYNINRMLSFIRRTKILSLNIIDDNYVVWIKRRVKYAVKAIREALKNIDYSGYEYPQFENEAFI